MLSPLTLAFVGDAVYGLLVRQKLAGLDLSPSRLHPASVRLVRAEAQARAAEALFPRRVPRRHRPGGPFRVPVPGRPGPPAYGIVPGNLGQGGRGRRFVQKIKKGLYTEGKIVYYST